MASKRKVYNKKFAVFVVRRKEQRVRRKRKEDPDYPELRIFVLEEKQIQKAKELNPKNPIKALALKNKGQYECILLKDGKEDIEYHEKELDAYKAAYGKLDYILKKKSKVDIHKESDKSNSVYCFRLKPNAWEYPRFKKANPHLTEKDITHKSSLIKAYYVGQTSKSIERRYKEHIDENYKGKNDWGKKYFIRPFNQAFENNLIQLFEKENGQPTNGLPMGKALIVEEQLAEWIREKNFGAYFA